jgi:hypothetical protein
MLMERDPTEVWLTPQLLKEERSVSAVVFIDVT